ncbi:MAG: cation-translocating P-type ATPase [Bryobacteraceae bacterium]
MDCGEEVSLLRARLSRVKGVRELRFDVARGRMEVEFAPELTNEGEIRAAVESAGMRCEPWTEQRNARQGEWQGERAALWLCGLLLAGGLGWQAWHGGDFLEALLAHSHAAGAHHHAIPGVAVALYAGSMAAGALLFWKKAWAALRSLRADMNLLVAVSMAGAAGLGEWAEGATLAFLFGLAGRLEAMSLERARRSVARLLELMPAQAWLVHGDHEHRVEAASLKPGARVRVKAGERVPCDGVVLEGAALVNQSPLTGESVAVEKRAGDEVFAGTLNEGGDLLVEVRRAAQDTRLQRTLRMLEESGSRKAESERLVERFARRYTPAVLALAWAVALLPPLAGAGAWSEWLYHGMVVLLIACPCAFVISTPVTVMAALASAARQGVLVKGGAFLEAAGRLKALAMDRAGILTQGEPRLARVETLGEAQGEELRQWQQWRTQQGGGIPLTPRWAAAGGATGALAAKIGELAEDGCTVAARAGEGVLEAWCDAPLGAARKHVEQLRALGLERIVLLASDPEPAAREAAEAAGIREVRAELSAEEKAAEIDRLQRETGAAAMVGDCTADAEALRRAAVGISVASPESETAQESADVIVTGPALEKVAFLVAHGRRALRVIRQNMALALGLKMAFLAAAAAGKATLWMAVAADTGATLLVTLNGLRLLRPTSHPSEGEG